MASLKIDESVFDKLAEILKKHNLSEVEYKDGEVRIRISSIAMSQQNEISRTVKVQDLSQDQNEIKPAEKSIDFNNHPGALKSPVIGTCYLAPEPGAQNFVSVGDSVQEGQPVLIIEAMKVMNLIKAHKNGKIVHIAVKNSAPVEFGQILLVIE